MVQWDFSADVDRLLRLAESGQAPRSMSQMVDATRAVVRPDRSDPARLQSWLVANAEALVGQQLLAASVHAQPSPLTDLPRVLHEWRARADDPSASAAVSWLKEEYPALLRAWLLARVEDLVAAELAPDGDRRTS